MIPVLVVAVRSIKNAAEQADSFKANKPPNKPVQAERPSEVLIVIGVLLRLVLPAKLV